MGSNLGSSAQSQLMSAPAISRMGNREWTGNPNICVTACTVLCNDSVNIEAYMFISCCSGFTKYQLKNNEPQGLCHSRDGDNV